MRHSTLGMLRRSTKSRVSGWWNKVGRIVIRYFATFPGSAESRSGLRVRSCRSPASPPHALVIGLLIIAPITLASIASAAAASPTGDDLIAPLPQVDMVAAPSFDRPTPLADLVSYAVSNNPEIKVARYQAQSLQTRVPQARSLPDPTLMTTTFLQEIQTASGPQDVALSLAQKFPWFGKRSLRGLVAQRDAAAAYSRAAATELEVIEQVKRAYFDLYFVQKAVEETEHLQKPLEDVIAVAQSRYETSSSKVGLESVFQAQIELAKLKAELVRLEATRRHSEARLNRALHLPPSTSLRATATVRRNRLEELTGYNGFYKGGSFRKLGLFAEVGKRETRDLVAV